jgi:hypothetical protein
VQLAQEVGEDDDDGEQEEPWGALAGPPLRLGLGPALLATAGGHSGCDGEGGRCEMGKVIAAGVKERSVQRKDQEIDEG